MKLHLPKLLCVALMSVLALPAMGNTLTSDNIVTPVEGSNSYLNVGMENTTDTWTGDLVVGDTAETQGDVDYVGAFNESWGWITPNGGSSNTTITSGLNVSGSLTVQNGGKIVLGGQYKGGDSYTGLQATDITVTGGSLTSTKIVTKNLVVSGGTVSTSTSNCTSGNSYAGASSKKQSYIQNSLTLSGGSLSFGYTSNVQGVGGGKHRMTSFGSSSSFTMTQTGGTMKVYGDMDLKSGSTITQGEGAGLMSLRDTIYMGGSGTTTFNQSGDTAKLVLGRLESTGNILSRPQCDFVFNQSGSGLIHLAYGSNLYKAGTITLNQTGAGTINIGGGHDTKITGSLPTRSDYSLTSFEAINTTYSINQTGTGTITLNSGAAITVNNIVANGTLNNNGTMNVTGEVKQSSGNISVSNGASLSASSVTVGGAFNVAEGGSLNAKTITVNNGGSLNVDSLTVGDKDKLTNNGTVQSTGTVTATGTVDNNKNMAIQNLVINSGTTTNAEGATLTAGSITVNKGATLINYGTISSANSAMMLVEGDDIAAMNDATSNLITIAGGKMEQYGVTTDNILVQNGGTLTLAPTMDNDALVGASVGAVTLEAGASMVVKGEAQTGALTLEGGTITFEVGASLSSTSASGLDKVEITVNLSDAALEAIKAGKGYAGVLFTVAGDNSAVLNGTSINFQSQNAGSYEATVKQDSEGKVTIGALVPEPTTATLSLLALAALAARRRRAA